MIVVADTSPSTILSRLVVNRFCLLCINAYLFHVPFWMSSATGRELRGTGGNWRVYWKRSSIDRWGRKARNSKCEIRNSKWEIRSTNQSFVRGVDCGAARGHEV